MENTQRAELYFILLGDQNRNFLILREPKLLLCLENNVNILKLKKKDLHKTYKIFPLLKF